MHPGPAPATTAWRAMALDGLEVCGSKSLGQDIIASLDSITSPPVVPPRIAGIVESFPEAEAKPTGRHMSLEVRNKRFGWFMIDHHGDGRVDLNCKASAEMHDILQRLVPAHFHVPKYVGSKGWVGVWLDVPKLDWAAVELALREAYVRVAPKKLVSQLVDSA